MAKKTKKIWTEPDLIKTFGLERLNAEYPLLVSWMQAETVLSETEQTMFEDLRKLIEQKGDFWKEESLKMNFIAPLLHLFVKINDEKGRYGGFFDEEISATVEGIYLQTETDFMLAKGIGDIAETPYFHFQEYKRSLKSPPEPMAQLLTAFLIAQEVNKNKKTLYGAIIVGRGWQFVAMNGKKYGASRLLDSTQKDDLLKIVAVLRKFKVILETELL